jgi:uncharacterized protein DUF4235
MAKLFFLPFSLLSGLLAGLLSKKAFELIWGRIDNREPPEPKSRQADFGKLALALALEGALFRLVKGLVDNGSRRGFASVTGAWPGEEGSAAPSEG